MKATISVFLLLLLLLAGCDSRERGPSSEPGALSPAAAGSSPGEPGRSVPAKPEQSGGGAAPSAPPGGPPEEDAPLAEILTVTVPEGYTLARVGMTLEEMGLCTAEEFILAAETGDFGMYPLVAAQAEDPGRCFRLEGYLFPATYQIYSGEAPDAVIRRMLEHTEQRITAELRDEIDVSGYTADQILTLASIIEKEAFGHEQMPLISSVLHNRLDAGMKLQCDVTITYVEGAIKPFIAGDVDRYNEHYNTYKCAALPSGAICNPGMDAILAALRPAESDYLYFVTDRDKNYHYAATWDQHTENIKKAGIGAA